MFVWDWLDSIVGRKILLIGGQEIRFLYNPHPKFLVILMKIILINQYELKFLDSIISEELKILLKIIYYYIFSKMGSLLYHAYINTQQPSDIIVQS
jgi:hypothetical protein